MCLALARVNLRIFERYPNLRCCKTRRAPHPESPTGKIFYKDDSHVVCDPRGCTFVEDDWCDAQTILHQGYGDCEELVAYFVADCWRTGRTAVRCRAATSASRLARAAHVHQLRQRRAQQARERSRRHLAHPSAARGGRGAPRIVDISRGSACRRILTATTRWSRPTCKPGSCAYEELVAMVGNHPRSRCSARLRSEDRASCARRLRAPDLPLLSGKTDQDWHHLSPNTESPNPTVAIRSPGRRARWVPVVPHGAPRRYARLPRREDHR